ncbi:MAG: DUF1232 domain-containing protein [Gammaproteobacteria bacterium]|nr:DUF1232 domain-containing protein [Gammaproteobacteria bacterium]MDH5345138.1 DUF1232 domain-containing protein [Gammaproteobacteria bacterium]
MGMRVSFDLDDDDLQHFRLVMRAARHSVQRISPEDVVAAAESLLASVGREKVPSFVGERLARLKIMIDMLTDHEWRLPKKDTGRVLNALAYFTDPEDLIPDHVPGIGFLDDAIMIELVVRELRHEIEAYEDFCEYRRNQPPVRGIKAKSTDLTREGWLDRRRKALQERMRRRRRASPNRIF